MSATPVQPAFAPRAPYPVILADPAWSYNDQGSRLAPRQGHYPVMSTEAICEMGAWVQGLAERDAFLFLWATNSLVLDGTATQVARAWGFEPRQLIPWIKVDGDGYPRLGGGHYTRVCSEQLLLCRRDKAKVRRRDIAGVIVAERTRHSAKPTASYRLIEALCEGPYLELFARRRFNERWDVWGNQAPAAREDGR